MLNERQIKSFKHLKEKVVCTTKITLDSEVRVSALWPAASAS